jgi:hypothetical protein
LHMQSKGRVGCREDSTASEKQTANLTPSTLVTWAADGFA